MEQRMKYDIAALFADREADRHDLHSRYLNEQMVRMLRAIGYDVDYCRGTGQYLFDRDGTRYLDLLSGFGVFGIGRNHPALRDALKCVLDSELPNLVQLGVSTLAGILAERLLENVPIPAPRRSRRPLNSRARPRGARDLCTATTPSTVSPMARCH